MHEFTSLLQTLGANIRAGRRARRLTQMDFAEEAGLHRTYIADAERGARNLSIKTVARIAKALGVSISDLCRDIDPPAS